MLHKTKGIELDRVGEWLLQYKQDPNVHEVSLSWEVAELPYTIPGHRDPAERFLVATAKL